MSKNQTKSENRRDNRFELLDYAIASRLGHSNIRSVVVDVSLGGLQVRSRSQFETSEVCTLSIGRGQLSPLQVHAEVRYSVPIEDSDLFATGFRIVPESVGERIEWVDYVHAVFQVQGEALLP